MKTKIKFLNISLFLVFLLLNILNIQTIFFTTNNLKVYATNENKLIIRAYGDSISYGETLSDLSKAYPSVFSQPYINNFGAEFQAHGVSGDTTTDLLNLLEPYNNGTATDMENFEDTDIILLCIGANNILGKATENLAGFLTGSVTEQEYQTLLDAGVVQFKEDYPKILNTFKNKQVIVMTIYNPYKYLTLNDIVLDPSATNYQMLVKAAISTYEAKLQKMLSMSMESLQLINNEIRMSNSNNVCVIDIWELFSGFSKPQYLEYVNANMGNTTLYQSDIEGLIQGNIDSVFSKIVSNCDPHPTVEGHEVIAQNHLNNYHCFKLNAKNLENRNNVENIEFEITSVLDGNFNYKLYKTTNDKKILLNEYSEKTFTIDSSQLADATEVYVEIYLNNQLISTSNIIQLKTDQSTSNNRWIYITVSATIILVATGSVAVGIYLRKKRQKV